MSTTPVTLGQYVTSKAPTKAQQAEKAYRQICNWLLDMHWASVDAHAAMQRAKRLAGRMDRMDDAYPIGTPERGEAESVHWHHTQAAKRETATVKRRAKQIAEAWPDLTPDYAHIVLVEIMPGWPDSPALEIVRFDPFLGRNPVWARLLAAATSDGDPANTNGVPF